MKKLTLAATLLLISLSAYASCSTHTYSLNGKFVTCTTCCYNGNCNTTCF